MAKLSFEDLKAKQNGIQYLTVGSNDFETTDKCMIAGPATAARNDYKPGAPAPTVN